MFKSFLKTDTINDWNDLSVSYAVMIMFQIFVTGSLDHISSMST